MEDFAKVYKWISSNFILVSLSIFLIIYLRWFYLTPLMFYNDPDYAYIVGLALLSFYILLGTVTKSIKKQALQSFLFIINTLLLIVNFWHIVAFFPKITSTIKCNGKAYYITWMHPFGDYQWSFHNVTIWNRYFEYESFFFGYGPGGYKLVCDSQKTETNIIYTLTNALAYTDGEKPRKYDEYADAELNNRLYFLAEECNDWVPSTCGSLTYILYECDLDYKSCDSIPIRYTKYDTRNFLYFISDEAAYEIKLYEESFETNESVLIFTYGKQSSCYVENCEILE